MSLCDTRLRRRRCEAAMAGLRLPRPFSVPELCRQVAERRGRPLHLHPLPAAAAAAGTCGLWLGTEAADHIFYEQRTGRLHQEHIVLHELAHILLDHHRIVPGGAGAERLLPDLDRQLVRRLMPRADYSTPQEREAETLATMLRLGGAAPARRPDEVLDRLRDATGVWP
ncbi:MULTISPECIES: hypothetical protein [Streptomyces]|uniref:Regulator component n=1 Tax=Streptomyces hygroscopicus TaxID=1912 RepID=A0ABQ3TVK1_STRHY|nr:MULTISPECIES: hypothetical protein [Streptomyces]MCO8306801.1 hypothetical protein [Streptomyces sp. RKCA744]MDN3059822.1 hypothetical protein [Streptomyces sp. SRF1]GHJ26961.1 hypothetical protein TPA0910_13940 [Streptomyces hygroscopicus]